MLISRPVGSRFLYWNGWVAGGGGVGVCRGEIGKGGNIKVNKKYYIKRKKNKFNFLIFIIINSISLRRPFSLLSCL